MRIAFTELELTLLMGFNLYQCIHEEKSKDEALEAITIIQDKIQSDTPLYQYALIAQNILSGKFKDYLMDLMINQEPNSKDFRTCQKLLLGYQSGVATDKGNLEALYKMLIELSVHQTNGNKALVIEAMENIDTIQEFLYQQGNSKGST